ncbi:DUF2509 family protein [Citrobacter rodentium]|uniref:Exported protein n=2 Tax=Citrobacter rodentium TaxID=67825 RepID=D2TIP4_CITRI|nr:DUF2509 family protein [Citrobacter rodentium]KIQ50324.1 hypothetical protein TA05_16200 [Citrobacter rodentium]QBY29324.1 DUF2509 family protein [Citrobacter rodentium]UHO33272.1 DUF2509 family protein [Citrobacter rodentium NBRC 105723 = DSM 16636]CBG89606.1 putative exported protein [Citrobacter rodentium ICC168]HAT8013789.1 hypothetical protein [Citrobacter rodentium NBRC 105723 = DSM 16636]
MNRERGVSSLALVLLLLALGSLLLQGVNQQHASFATRVAMESTALQRQALVQSAMEWGRVQPWKADPARPCRYYAAEKVPVCLRMFADNQLLLITQFQGTSLWRLGEWVAGAAVFSPHGWSDFCPLREAALCQLP